MRSGIALHDRAVVVGHGITRIGDQALWVALALAAQGRGGAVATLAAAAVGRTVGMAVGLAACALTRDRGGRVRAAGVADLMAAIPAVAIASGAWEAAIPIVVLMFGAQGSADALHNSAVWSIKPEGDPSGLPRFYGWLSGIENVAVLSGPVVGAVLFNVAGVVGVGALNAASYAISGAALVGRRAATLTSQETRATEDDEGPHATRAEASRFILDHPWMLSLFVLAAAHVFVAVGPWRVVNSLVLADRGATLLAAFGVASGVGSIVGAFLGSRLAHHRRRGMIALAGIATFALTCGGVGLGLSAVMIVALAAAGGAGTEIANVIRASAYGTAVPDHLRSRVFALDDLASFSLYPAGQALAPVWVAVAGLHGTLIAGGIFVTATSALPLLIPGVAGLRDSSPDSRPPEQRTAV